MGLYVKPTITVYFSIRNLSKAYVFAVLVILLQSILDIPHIADVDSKEKPSLLPLMAHKERI